MRHGSDGTGGPLRGEAAATRKCSDSLRVDWSRVEGLESPVAPDALPASMGIYVFNRAVLDRGAREQRGRLRQARHPAHHRDPSGACLSYQGYWEDIGTIRSFYEANLDLCEPLPKFNFYDATAPIFTHARYLPGTKIISGRIERSVIADGCIINDALIEHSLMGVRARIEAGATIRDSLIMGADYYETPDRACAGRGAADRDRPGCVDRAGHRGQERPDRRLGAHHARGQAGPVRRAQFLRPRRHRGGPQERRHRERDRDLTPAARPRRWATVAGIADRLSLK